VHQAEAKKKENKTEFIAGYDYGRVFLKPHTKKGKGYRQGIWNQIMRWLPWLVYFIPYEIVEMGSRAHLESRGNWWSKTKDTTIYEAGLTSVGYEFTKWVCAQWGVCGDPCGDPAFSIALSAYQRFLGRMKVFYEAEDTFWDDIGLDDGTLDHWLLVQAEENRFEAEALIGACGATNCQKLRVAIKIAHRERDILGRVGDDGAHHAWWYLMSWFRDQTRGTVAAIFYPKENYKQLGLRYGRATAMKEMRAEFFVRQLNGQLIYGWEIDPVDYALEMYPLAYYPHHAVVEMDPKIGPVVTGYAPDFPEPLYPTGPKFMRFNEWRKQCADYGGTVWKRITGEPKRNDRWRSGGTKTLWDGTKIKVKKGYKKYASDAEFEAAHAAWEVEMKKQGVLPTDEEFAWAWAELERLGFALVKPEVIDEP